MALLTLEDLHLSSAAWPPSPGVSLEVHAGDFLAIIGPNGAGKTSIFNCISGIYAPSHGPHPLRRPGHHRPQAAPARAAADRPHLPEHRPLQGDDGAGQRQDRPAHPPALGRCSPAGSTTARRRARSSRIAPRSSARSSICSSCRTSGTRSSARCPTGCRSGWSWPGPSPSIRPCSCSTSPTAGMNAEETEDMVRFILYVKQVKRLTVVMIEHDMGVVMDISDRVAVLDFGKKIAEGTPAEVQKDPVGDQGVPGRRLRGGLDAPTTRRPRHVPAAARRAGPTARAQDRAAGEEVRHLAGGDLAAVRGPRSRGVPGPRPARPRARRHGGGDLRQPARLALRGAGRPVGRRHPARDLRRQPARSGPAHPRAQRGALRPRRGPGAGRQGARRPRRPAAPRADHRGRHARARGLSATRCSSSLAAVVEAQGRALDERGTASVRGVAGAGGSPTDVALLAYTSGTTGVAEGRDDQPPQPARDGGGRDRRRPVREGDEIVSFLPFAWVGEQLVSVAIALHVGATVNFPEEPETLREDLREIGPHVMIAPPRFWEAMCSEYQVKIADAGFLKRLATRAALAIGERAGGAKERPRPPAGLARRALHGARLSPRVPHHAGQARALARAARVYRRRARSAPRSSPFFRTIGLNLKQVYGQTETAGICVLHPDGEVRAETVGKPTPGTQVRISDERRDSRRGRERVPRLLQESRRDRDGARRRLAPHRRRGTPRRARATW